MAADSQPKSKRARSSGDRDAIRGRLCDAAAKLFLEEGEAAQSMRRLAAEVGCSPMAPYRHFADKEALVAAIRAQAFNRLADALDASSGDDRHRARDIGDAYVQFARENPAAYQADVRPRPAGRGGLSRTGRRRRPSTGLDVRLCPRTGRGPACWRAIPSNWATCFGRRSTA
ncbi:MAG: TetR/AcrR family transcriptional regulator [Caulobacteraceae bacterium]